MLVKELSLAGCFLILFFLVVIIQKKQKRIKDYLLAAFFLTVGSELLFRYLLTFSNSQWIVFFDLFYWALLGPVIWLYANSVRHVSFKFKLRHFLHLGILACAMFAYIQFLTGQFNSFIPFYNESRGLTKFALTIWEFGPAIYLIFVIILLINHKKQVKHYFSSGRKKELNWLYYLTIGFTVYIFGAFSLWLLKGLFNLSISFKPIEIIAPVLLVYSFGFGIYGIRQGIIWPQGNENDLPDGKTQRKYKTSALKKDDIESIASTLQTYMEQKKPYLDCELNIHQLATHINTTIHKLSQVINQKHRMNFSDYVNKYRIEEFIYLYHTPGSENLKIIHLAYQCGFNSKSSFYSIFKKQTGQTPGEYFKSDQAS